MNKPHKILIVEEAIVATNLRPESEKLGYQVAKVDSGEEAIQEVKESRPDLILIDIGLKGKMNGIEAIRNLRTSFDIPAILLGAYTDRETIEQINETNPFGILGKPININLLKFLVKKALSANTKIQKNKLFYYFRE